MYRTAFTLTETLSRVITSCGGMSSATIRSEHPLHLGQPQRHEGEARTPLPGELAEEEVHPTLVLLEHP